MQKLLQKNQDIGNTPLTIKFPSITVKETELISSAGGYGYIWKAAHKNAVYAVKRTIC